VEYLLLFFNGIITFISPCLLPMLPVYISFFAGGALEGNRRRALINSLGFVLGFTFVFVLLGVFAGTIGRLISSHRTLVDIIFGAIVIAFGLNYIGIMNIPFLNKTFMMKADTKNLGLFSSVLFGIVFSVGWTPCVGAFLGSALMMASQQGSTLKGVLMLLCYSAGLGIPFVVSAVLIDSLKTAFDFIKRHYKVVKIVSGSLLVVVGLLMMSGYMNLFLSLLSF